MTSYDIVPGLTTLGGSARILCPLRTPQARRMSVRTYHLGRVVIDLQHRTQTFVYFLAHPGVDQEQKSPALKHLARFALYAV